MAVDVHAKAEHCSYKRVPCAQCGGVPARGAAGAGALWRGRRHQGGVGPLQRGSAVRRGDGCAARSGAPGGPAGAPAPAALRGRRLLLPWCLRLASLRTQEAAITCEGCALLHGHAHSRAKGGVQGTTDVLLRLQVEEVPDQEWMDSVRSSYQPTQVAEGMWIIPRYAPPPHRLPDRHLPCSAAEGAAVGCVRAVRLCSPQLRRWCEAPCATAVSIVLEPGLAFGTGEHATTRLCLRALLRMPLSGARVMDYGTGVPRLRPQPKRPQPPRICDLTHARCSHSRAVGAAARTCVANGGRMKPVAPPPALRALQDWVAGAGAGSGVLAIAALRLGGCLGGWHRHRPAGGAVSGGQRAPQRRR